MDRAEASVGGSGAGLRGMFGICNMLIIKPPALTDRRPFPRQHHDRRNRPSGRSHDSRTATRTGQPNRGADGRAGSNGQRQHNTDQHTETRDAHQQRRWFGAHASKRCPADAAVPMAGARGA